MRSPLQTVVAAAALACLLSQGARAQRHNGGSSPPTAPNFNQHPTKGTQPILPVSSGMGALQFAAVNYGVSAPQSLTRQLQAEDERTRAAALSAIGAPPQYLVRGHIPTPHSLHLDFVALGNNDDLQGLLTVELDQHIVSAILISEDGNWKRIASMVYATPYDDPASTPSTFLRLARSLVQRTRYRAIYHASANGPNGSFIENEANVRVLNDRAIVVMSFVSNERSCPATPSHAQHPTCDLTQRWLQSDPADPTHRAVLITGTGRYTQGETADPFANSRQFQLTHLHTFSCQPFLFSEGTMHFEPTANSGACKLPR